MSGISNKMIYGEVKEMRKDVTHIKIKSSKMEEHMNNSNRQLEKNTNNIIDLNKFKWKTIGALGLFSFVLLIMVQMVV